MTIPAFILVACVLVGCGIQWRRNVLALRAKNHVLAFRAMSAEALAEVRRDLNTCPSCKRDFADWEHEVAE